MTWALKTHGLQHSCGNLPPFCGSPLVLSAKGRRTKAPRSRTSGEEAELGPTRWQRLGGGGQGGSGEPGGAPEGALPQPAGLGVVRQKTKRASSVTFPSLAFPLLPALLPP